MCHLEIRVYKYTHVRRWVLHTMYLQCICDAPCMVHTYISMAAPTRLYLSPLFTRCLKRPECGVLHGAEEGPPGTVSSGSRQPPPPPPLPPPPLHPRPGLRPAAGSDCGSFLPLSIWVPGREDTSRGRCPLPSGGSPGSSQPLPKN